MKQTQDKNPIVRCVCWLMLLYSSLSFACSIEGSWHGLLGNKPITLQLALTDYSKQSTGSYFYDMSGEPLYLKYDIDKNVWTEHTMAGKVTGEITDFSCKEEILTALWHSTNDETSYLITANRTEKYESIWHIPIIMDKKTYYFKQHPYRILRGKGTNIYTIQISENYQGAQTLNKNAKAYLHESLDNHLACFDAVWNSQSSGHGLYEASDKIIDFNKKYIVIYEKYYQYCGQAHGDGGAGGNIFSLKTGLRIDTGNWIKQSALLDIKYKSIDTEKPFGKLLKKTYLHRISKNMTDNCIDQIDFYVSPWATYKGLYFHAIARSYAARACNDEVLIPFQAAKPFLTAKGKNAIQPFLEKS